MIWETYKQTCPANKRLNVTTARKIVLHLYRKLVRKDRMKTWLLYYTRTKQTWQPPPNKNDHGCLRNRCNVRRVANGNTLTDSLRPSGNVTAHVERAKPENVSHGWGAQWHSSLMPRTMSHLRKASIKSFPYFCFRYLTFPVFPTFVLKELFQCIVFTVLTIPANAIGRKTRGSASRIKRCPYFRLSY